jgi:hypothetical protein
MPQKLALFEESTVLSNGVVQTIASSLRLFFVGSTWVKSSSSSSMPTAANRDGAVDF